MTTIVKPHGKRFYGVPIPQTGDIGFYQDYKEPLKPLENGYGYEGVLLYNETQDRIQCHVCGGWFHALGAHIVTHGFHTARAYKEEYGLMARTSLVGEGERARRVKVGRARIGTPLMARLKAHRIVPEKGKHQPTRRNVAEHRNKHGYCADQLLLWLREHPNAQSSTSMRHTQQIRYIFGSWNEGRRLAGLPVFAQGGHPVFDIGVGLEALRSFAARTGYSPSTSDVRRGLLPYSTSAYRKVFGSWKEALRAAGLSPRPHWRVHPNGKHNSPTSSQRTEGESPA